MRKEIGLITENMKVIPEYIQQIYDVFGDALIVNTYSVEERSAFRSKKDSLYLFSAYSSKYFEDVRKTLRKEDILIPINLSFRRKNLLPLNAYPKGTHAILVNVTKRMAEETITAIHQAGFNNIEFTPHYPGCGQNSSFKLAFTPGEAELIPDYIEDRVDIGSRQINARTIAELAVKLDLEYILETKRFLDLSERLFDLSDGFSHILGKYKVMRKQFDALVHTLDVGIIGIDAAHKVFACNHKAAHALAAKRNHLLHNDVAQFIPKSTCERCKLQQVPVKTQLHGVGEEQLELSLTPIISGTQYIGAFALITQADSLDKNALTAEKTSRKGHIARYNFADIIGNSPAIQRTVELAKMMAKTDSSILITGESGTGKELFAHSIHNASQRAQGPFVAINCAAIPDTLLESELFGYEEGSFTGAKKGGKTGLFEIAINGTLFLDEIEGMSQNLQVKLLRVIQEREIMRVGGDAIIPIDVRIISASNQELLPLTIGGNFRGDLFYRLSTLPVELPALRKRREDILLLIEEFKDSLNASFILIESTKKILIGYEWPGNIRELRNCVEFFKCLNLSVIEPDNLPFAIQRFTSHAQNPHDSTGELLGEIMYILQRKPCGRKSILKALKLSGILLTESQLRAQLDILKASGWISSAVGRGGSHITADGLNELKNRRK